MIDAIAETKGGTLIPDLSPSVYDLYEKLTSIGIHVAPNQVILADREIEHVFAVYMLSEFQ